MADKSGSPAFKPPMDTITDSDPQIKRVPLDKTDWGFRKSQDPSQSQEAAGSVRHIPNEG